MTMKNEGKIFPKFVAKIKNHQTFLALIKFMKNIILMKKNDEIFLFKINIEHFWALFY